MWTVWDKTSDINGFSAESVLESFKHLKNEETIFIKTEGDTVAQMEGKNILASVYGIDPALPDDEFLAEYERVTAEPTEPTEPDEPAGGESATYDELAQVYREGVNSLDE